MAVLSPRVKPIEPREPQDAIPPLENGDRLSRAEFERRYEAMPDLKKAELIEGEVYVGSPVRHRQHSAPHGQLMTWLGTYSAATPNVEFGDSGSLRLDMANVPQPDAFLMIKPECGGRVRITDDDYVEGAPEFIAEIAASSVSYDLGKKLHAYRRNEVREYLVWRVQDREIDWLVLRHGCYDPLGAGDDGILRSTVFPGLWLDRTALLRGDLAAVLAVVQQGLASADHAALVGGLRGA